MKAVRIHKFGEPEVLSYEDIPEPQPRKDQVLVRVRACSLNHLDLWVRQGRPVAAVTFFTFKWPDGDRVIVHERHSFAQEPVEATWRGRPVCTWRPSRPPPGLASRFRPARRSDRRGSSVRSPLGRSAKWATRSWPSPPTIILPSASQVSRVEIRESRAKPIWLLTLESRLSTS